MADQSIFHSTDLDFVNVCRERFGLNRGIYNTIDKWCFDNGFVHIVHRREFILSFLEFYHTVSEGKKINFGRGGVIPAINHFINRNGESTFNKRKYAKATF